MLHDKTSPFTRRIVTLGTPIAGVIIGILHPLPVEPSIAGFLRPRIGLWLGVHVAQLFLVGFLGLTLWILTRGIEGRAARYSRAAIIPFLVFYSAYDSIVGISTGLLVWQAQGLTGQELVIADQVAQRFWNARIDVSTPLPGLLIILADSSWIIASIATAFAIRKAGASKLAFALMILAGVFFGIDHPFPTGTVGMLCLLGAVIMLERRDPHNKQQTLARHQSENS